MRVGVSESRALTLCLHSTETNRSMSASRRAFDERFKHFSTIKRSICGRNDARALSGSETALSSRCLFANRRQSMALGRGRSVPFVRFSATRRNGDGRADDSDPTEENKERT